MNNGINPRVTKDFADKALDLKKSSGSPGLKTAMRT